MLPDRLQAAERTLKFVFGPHNTPLSIDDQYSMTEISIPSRRYSKDLHPELYQSPYRALSYFSDFQSCNIMTTESTDEPPFLVSPYSFDSEPPNPYSVLDGNFTPKDRSKLKHVTILGHGALGVVEAVALDRERGRQYFARKQIQYQHTWSKHLKDMRKEAEILKSLSHSHIVKLLDSWDDISPQRHQRYFYMLMRPAAEQNLKQFLNQWSENLSSDSTVNQIRNNPLEPFWNLLKWPHCLVSALKYMHSEGVRHQDIKPANIVHHCGHIYFTDFGSCRRFQPNHTTSTEYPASATWRYAAPEVFPNLDIGTEVPFQLHGTAADVFSLGAVFLEMSAILGLKSIHKLTAFCFGDQQYPKYAEAYDRIEQWRNELDFPAQPYHHVTADTFWKETWQRSFSLYFLSFLMLYNDKALRPTLKQVQQILDRIDQSLESCTYGPGAQRAKCPLNHG
jgi:serine/threonine protein kinase